MNRKLNKKKFLEYCIKLLKRNEHNPYCLFGDGLCIMYARYRNIIVCGNILDWYKALKQMKKDFPELHKEIKKRVDKRDNSFAWDNNQDRLKFLRTFIKSF